MKHYHICYTKHDVFPYLLHINDIFPYLLHRTDVFLISSISCTDMTHCPNLLHWNHVFHPLSSLWKGTLPAMCITAGLGTGLALFVRFTPLMVPREDKIAGFLSLSGLKAVSSGAGMVPSLCKVSSPISSSWRGGTTVSPWAWLAWGITTHWLFSKSYCEKGVLR